MTIDEMQEKLKTMLLEKRYYHSINVMEMAKKLALFHGADAKKAAIAGLLHDCAKNYTTAQMLSLCEKCGIELDEIMQNQTGLIHGYLGEFIARSEFGICDTEILDAIKYHTVGKENMPIITKIVYVADSIEPLRKFDGVDHLRELAFTDIDRALVYQIDMTIRSILSRGALLHTKTIATRNYYLRKIR